MERLKPAEVSNQLLKNKYDLHKRPEVEAAANRHLVRTGEKVPQNPLLRIQNYLDRFHEITDRQDTKKREHGINAFKKLLYCEYIIKPNEIPESYWEKQRCTIRERDQETDLKQGGWEDLKRQKTETIMASQKSSLDKWIDYLFSSEAPYPDSLKYFTLRSVLNMGEYNKKNKMYPQRSKGTTKPFPELNREALSFVLNTLERKYKGEYFENLFDFSEEDNQEFEELFEGENFAKLYALAIQKVNPVSPEDLSITEGEWVKYNQGSNHLPFAISLHGYGTGWCIAEEIDAEYYLKNGDFYVYYSKDKDGKPAIPRAVIYLQKNNLIEIRGIAPGQNLDTSIIPIVEKKLEDFPDGSLYERRLANMHHLNAIERQSKMGQKLMAKDLAFLYEVDKPIECFGDDKDPRIEELLSQRDPQEDMPIAFGCTPDQIARDISQVRGDTKAYVGPLVPDIFAILQNVEYIFTSFPEGNVRRYRLEIGGKTAQELEQAIEQSCNYVSSVAKEMLHSDNFTTLKDSEVLDTVIIGIQDLGFSSGDVTIDQIYDRAKVLGLRLCPAETGPHLRLASRNQTSDDFLCTGMEPIISSSFPHIFSMTTDDFGLPTFYGSQYKLYKASNPYLKFIFNLPKKT